MKALTWAINAGWKHLLIQTQQSYSPTIDSWCIRKVQLYQLVGISGLFSSYNEETLCKWQMAVSEKLLYSGAWKFVN